MPSSAYNPYALCAVCGKANMTHEIPNHCDDTTQCDACGKVVPSEQARAGFECDYCPQCFVEAANAHV
jgi:hypothetical protein